MIDTPAQGDLAIARRFQPQRRETGKRLRINEAIRTSPIRLISDENEQIGVIDVSEAKRMAREAGLDLVEVSPNSSPPVCRIMDYGKWKYQQKKKEQKAKSHSKQSELKGVRLRPKIDEHDLLIKTTRAREFLGDGDKVQFTMLFRGREMAHRDLGMKLMRDIAAGLEDVSKTEQPPRHMGRRMTMLLVPDRKSGAKHGDDKPKSSEDKPKPAAAATSASAAPAPPAAEAPARRPVPEPAANA